MSKICAATKMKIIRFKDSCSPNCATQDPIYTVSLPFSIALRFFFSMYASIYTQRLLYHLLDVASLVHTLDSSS